MKRRLPLLILVAIGAITVPAAQSRITSPKEALGFNFGDDYQLANYAQIAAYWKKLESESDRLPPCGSHS